MQNVLSQLKRPIARGVSNVLQRAGYKIERTTAGLRTSQDQPNVYNENGLQSARNHDFVNDTRFKKAIKFALGGVVEQHFAVQNRFAPHGRWNFHVDFWAASHALRLNWDLVQLGVFSGTGAAGIVKYTDFQNYPSRKFYLVDTFTGVPAEQWTEEELRNGANSAQWLYKEAGDTCDKVRQRFSDYKNVVIVQGKVPDILPLIPVEQIALLMLDMNAAYPELCAANFFWDRLVSGGLLLSDDYGHGHQGVGYFCQKRVLDDFAESKNLSVLALPTGHGLLIKP
jgi:hypothetical protein